MSLQADYRSQILKNIGNKKQNPKLKLNLNILKVLHQGKGHDGHGHEENFDEVADSLSSGLEAEDSSDPIVAKIEENSSKVENTDESEVYKQTQAVLFWDEDVWAVDQINSTNDINWFEMEHVKEYYTQQSGEILKKFIEKYKTLKKAVTEKEKDLRLASSSAYEKVGQQLLQ